MPDFSCVVHQEARKFDMLTTWEIALCVCVYFRPVTRVEQFYWSITALHDVMLIVHVWQYSLHIIGVRRVNKSRMYHNMTWG